MMQQLNRTTRKHRPITLSQDMIADAAFAAGPDRLAQAQLVGCLSCVSKDWQVGPLRPCENGLAIAAHLVKDTEWWGWRSVLLLLNLSPRSCRPASPLHLRPCVCMMYACMMCTGPHLIFQALIARVALAPSSQSRACTHAATLLRPSSWALHCLLQTPARRAVIWTPATASIVLQAQPPFLSHAQASLAHRLAMMLDPPTAYEALLEKSQKKRVLHAEVKALCREQVGQWPGGVQRGGVWWWVGWCG